ncbi:hypothetical protein F5884DRAFT_467646 [Xylogone sp. PMI_703]|nr:hypothetical protein F5884DRAFT_467646 [Xylogone sp. PMI_703]
MSSLMLKLGFGSSSQAPPNLSANFLIGHFLFAYGIMSSRTPKQYLKLDHNVSPREDLAKYGPKMVSEGKISQRTLGMLKRWESAHANAVENYTLFVASVLLANHAGVPTSFINGSMASYTVARIAYAIAYIVIDRPALSQLRGMCWWWGNTSCLILLWNAGKRLV